MANTNNRQQILDFYDRGWHPLVAEYYGHSDYMNYGYWTADTRNQAEASDNLIGRLLAMIPEKKGRILDVACGRGASTRHLLRHYQPSDIVAINISEKQLKRASELAPGCTFLLRDATRLEFPDCSFDNVMCVEAAFHFDTRDSFYREALRVLKPGGTIAFATWPPEVYTGRMFAMMGKYMPPPPPGVSPPPQWGHPDIARERLGDAVTDLTFDRGQLRAPNLSVGHVRAFMEQNVGPVMKILVDLTK